MQTQLRGAHRELLLYFIIISLSSLGLGLSDSVFSNYFREVYNVSAYLRGVIEFPRETPGVILVFIIGALSFMGDIRLSMLAQGLSIFGILALGFLTPTFPVMLVFLFINSLGMHMFMPLQDTIGITVAQNDALGKRLGQFSGVRTAFSLVASLVVFFGFRSGVFSFQSPIKWVFVISGVLFICVLLLLFPLNKCGLNLPKSDKKFNVVIRKKYGLYYLLAILGGAQKQIAYVYGPWVLIELLRKQADTLAILGAVSALIGVIFLPLVGRMIDKFGIKKMMYADALTFIVVYLMYGFYCAGLVNAFPGVTNVASTLIIVGLPVALAYIILILDRMSMQLGMVRLVYLRSIIEDKNEITTTLSMGMSMDHVISIASAFLGGIVWTTFGPQYVFFFGAILSLGNLFVAYVIKPQSQAQCE